MQSTLTLEDIISLSKAQKTVALTDVNTIRGFINFVQCSQSNKVATNERLSCLTADIKSSNADE